MSVQAISWAYSQTVGSPTRKMVLVALANRHNADTGRCCPKIDFIAHELEINEKTVRRALAKLEEDGYIGRHRSRRQDGFFGVYHYTLGLDSESRPPVTESAGEGDTESGPEPEVVLNRSVPTGTGVDAPDTAQTLVAEIVDSAKNHGVPLSRRSIGHFAREIHTLLGEGFDPDTIRAGLQRMAQKGKLQPALLAGFASETRLPTSQPLRYGRGLTTAQILELGRSMNGDTGTGG